MSTAIARQITSDIKWLLEDAGLVSKSGYRVTTAVKDGHYETVILNFDPDLVKRALAERARHHGLTFDLRPSDGALVVRQPV